MASDNYSKVLSKLNNYDFSQGATEEIVFLEIYENQSVKNNLLMSLNKTSVVSEVIEMNQSTGMPTPWILREQLLWFGTSDKIEKLISDFLKYFQLEIGKKSYTPHFYKDYGNDCCTFSGYLVSGPFFLERHYKNCNSEWYWNTISQIPEEMSDDDFAQKFNWFLELFDQTDLVPKNEKLQPELKPLAITQNAGFVYVMTNGLLPDQVKIGYTNREPRVRAAELTIEAALPAPYKIHLALAVHSADKIEKTIHENLSALRLNKEFFKLDTKQIARTFSEVAAAETQRNLCLLSYKTELGEAISKALRDLSEEKEIERNIAIVSDFESNFSSRNTKNWELLHSDVINCISSDYKNDRNSEKQALERAIEISTLKKDNCKFNSELGWVLFGAAFITYGITLIPLIYLAWFYYPNKENKLQAEALEAKNALVDFNSETEKTFLSIVNDTLDKLPACRIDKAFLVVDDSNKVTGFVAHSYDINRRLMTFIGYLHTAHIGLEIRSKSNAAYNVLLRPRPGEALLAIRIFPDHVMALKQVPIDVLPEWFRNCRWINDNEGILGEISFLHKLIINLKKNSKHNYFYGVDSISPFNSSFYQTDDYRVPF